MPTLLVVDDEPAILQSIRLAFQPAEVNLVTATTAAEGLAQFAWHQPDVVILDVDLSDDSGVATYQRIRQLNPRVSIILITGDGSTLAAIEALAQGDYDAVPKPVPLNELRRLVLKTIEVNRVARDSPHLLLDLERFIQQRLQNGSMDLYAEWQAVAEGHLFTQVLRHTGGNLSCAARILGINRITLRTRLKSLGLAPKNPVKQPELAS